MSLEVQDPWFTEIEAKRKTVEGRVGHNGKFDHLIGEDLLIVGPEYTITVKVRAVRHYKDLCTYIAAEGWERIAPHTSSNEEAERAYRRVTMVSCGLPVAVFSPERIDERGGINAIELE